MIRTLVRRYRIAVFNFHFPAFDAANVLILRKLGLYNGKVVVSFHGSDIRAALSSNGPRRWLMRWIVRNADAAVPPSKALGEEVLAFEPKANIRVVYNAVDLDKFRPGLAASVSRRIVTIGRFEYRKGHDILIAAFKKLLPRYPAARLQIIGSTGPELEATRALIARNNLGDSVELLVNVPHDRIPRLLAEAEIVVMSSRHIPGKMGEGFPLLLLEAGAVARPVVTTRTTGADEIIVDHETGRLVITEDPEALVRALGDVLDDPAKGAAMGRDLRHRIEREFRWDIAWRRYRDLVGPIGGPPR